MTLGSAGVAPGDIPALIPPRNLQVAARNAPRLPAVPFTAASGHSGTSGAADRLVVCIG
jgi:hypothetical protein